MFAPQHVLLDFGFQPLMLEASTIAGLRLTKHTLEKCHPYIISTSMQGMKHASNITKEELTMKNYQGDVQDPSFMKVKAIVMEAKS